MKIKLLGSGLAAMLAITLQNCAAEIKATSTDDLKMQLDGLQTLWDKGDALGYLKGTSDLCDRISSSNDISVRAELGRLILRSLFSKDLRMAQAEGVLDLSIWNKAIGLILDEPQPSLRRSDSRLVCESRRRFLSERIENFSPRKVVQNVTPPGDTQGLTFSGMAPEAIRDPVARAKYEAAIRENQQNAITNKRQRLIEDHMTVYNPLIEQYLIRTFKGERDLQEELAECLRLGQFSNEAKDRIVNETR